MDEATKAYRRSQKANNTPRGELSPFESRGLGRKAKPTQTFPTVRCNYKDPETKIRCPRAAKTANVEFKTMFGIRIGAFCLTCLPNVKR